MLTSTSATFDLHMFTMDMYRTRISAAFLAAGHPATARLIDELARLVDMSAAERVLDEAEQREIPNPEHPGVRDLRARLRHAETLIAHLTAVPALRAAAWFQQESLTPSERRLLARFVQEVHRESSVPSRAGIGEAYSEGSADTFSLALETVEHHANLVRRDSAPDDAALTVLENLQDDLRALRAYQFRDSAVLDALEAPLVCLTPEEHLPQWLRDEETPAD